MRTITITEKVYQQLRSVVENGVSRMDPTGDPEETQFSYCVYCHTVEYMPHRKECAGLPLLDIFNIKYEVQT
jgi:hypothetical protein